MKALKLITTISIMFLLINSSCNKNENVIHYPNASSNNIDDNALYIAIEKARNDRGILSIIVERNNESIVEEYFGTNTSESTHPIRSVTKSVTSLLFGLALDKGLINNLDGTVGDYLQEYLSPTDTLVSYVKIKDLLSMSGGFDWEELLTYEDFNDWALSADHLTYALQVPILDDPGTQFTYTTPGCQILSAIFTKATGYTLENFAIEFLYPELEIEGERPWGEDQHNYNYGGIGLNLRSKDMLKIGSLFLNNGIFNEKQVLSESWVNESTTSQISTNNATYYASQYGYLWWIGEKNGIAYYFANGYGGQFIFIFPELELVVVAQSEIGNAYRSPNEQWMNTISIIMEDIFDSVN